MTMVFNLNGAKISDPKKEKPSGPEIMMRSLGMGQAIDAVKMLIEQGALQKILDFAEHAGELRAEVKDLKNEIKELKELLVYGRMPVEARPDTPGELPGDAVPALSTSELHQLATGGD